MSEQSDRARTKKALEIITKCDGCPNERHFTGPNRPGRECRAAEYREIAVRRGMPKWRPLPDVVVVRAAAAIGRAAIGRAGGR